MKTLPAEINLQAILESDNGLRVEIQHGMRAPVVNGNVTLEPCWRADCYERVGTKWKLHITLVGETPADVLNQLAALSIEGAVPILGGTDERRLD